MHHLRRVGIVIAGLLVSMAGLLGAAPAAFAMHVAPPEGSSGPLQPATLAHTAGTPTWQVALIIVGVTLAVLSVVAAVVWVRRRVALRPAVQ